jgi:hypothetical protein
MRLLQASMEEVEAALYAVSPLIRRRRLVLLEVVCGSISFMSVVVTR